MEQYLQEYIKTNNQFFTYNPNIQKTFNLFSQTVDYKDQQIVFALNIIPYKQPSSKSCIVDFGPKGIIRCYSCKSYMNPMNLITQKKKQYICAICKSVNTIPDYYQPHSSLVQLSKMSYIIKPGPNEFVINQTIGPYYIFLIQSTTSFLKSQMYQMTISAIRNSLQNLNPKQNILLISYNQCQISIYDLLTQEPTMYIITDDQKPIKLNNCAVQDSFIYVLENLGENNPKIYIRNKGVVKKAMQYAITLLIKLGGKIFHICENEIDYKPTKEEQKKKQYQAQNSYYINVGNLCLKNNISYYVFIFSKLASVIYPLNQNLINIGELIRLCQGQLYFYNYTEQQYYKFYYDLYYQLTVQTGFACSNKIRYSCNVFYKKLKQLQQLNVTSDWKTNYLHVKNNPNLIINYTNLNPNKIITIQFQLMKNTNQKYLIIQNSTSYITSQAKVMINVQNIAIQLHPQLKYIHVSFDYQNLIFYFYRKIMSVFIQKRTVNQIKSYILFYAKNIKRIKYQWANSLIIFSLAVLKNKLFLTNNLAIRKIIEQRWAILLASVNFNPSKLYSQYVPSLFKIDLQAQPQINENGFVFPPMLSLHIDSIKDSEYIYLMDCGSKIMILLDIQENKFDEVIKMINSNGENILNLLIRELKQLRWNKHVEIVYVYRDGGTQNYLQFMNYLIYSRGTLQFYQDLNEFTDLL